MQWIIMHRCIRDMTRCMTSANTSQMLSRRLFDDGQCDTCASSSLNPVSCPLGSFAWSCQKPTSHETGKTRPATLCHCLTLLKAQITILRCLCEVEGQRARWQFENRLGLCIKINDAVEFYSKATNRGDLKVMRCCVQMHPVGHALNLVKPGTWKTSQKCFIFC